MIGIELQGNPRLMDKNYLLQVDNDLETDAKNITIVTIPEIGQ